MDYEPLIEAWTAYRLQAWDRFLNWAFDEFTNAPVALRKRIKPVVVAAAAEVMEMFHCFLQEYDGLSFRNGDFEHENGPYVSSESVWKHDTPVAQTMIRAFGQSLCPAVLECQPDMLFVACAHPWTASVLLQPLSRAAFGFLHQGYEMCCTEAMAKHDAPSKRFRDQLCELYRCLRDRYESSVIEPFVHKAVNYRIRLNDLSQLVCSYVIDSKRNCSHRQLARDLLVLKLDQPGEQVRYDLETQGDQMCLKHDQWFSYRSDSIHNLVECNQVDKELLDRAEDLVGRVVRMRRMFAPLLDAWSTVRRDDSPSCDGHFDALLKNTPESTEQHYRIMMDHTAAHFGDATASSDSDANQVERLPVAGHHEWSSILSMLVPEHLFPFAHRESRFTQHLLTWCEKARLIRRWTPGLGGVVDYILFKGAS